MARSNDCTVAIHTAKLDGQEYMIRNVIPKFDTVEEKEKRQKQIEAGLFDIFRKYKS